MIQSTAIWRRTLLEGASNPENSPALERLRTSLESVRGKAEILSAEIVRDLPDFTRHDHSHHDGIWALADQIVDEDLVLTPAEAYVFGLSVLLHDLGLGLAAYPGGRSELEQLPEWPDQLAFVFRDTVGRLPTAEDLDAADEEIKTSTVERVLRVLHSKRAAQLAETTWNHPTLGELQLIEDAELRQAFGRVVGKIAESHWLPISELPAKFEIVLTAPAFLPNTWTVDPLKIALLLRTADACHLDASRAPSLLRAVRRPSAESDKHWSFQEKLHQPRVVGDRLEFTSGDAFAVESAEAWWLCLDMLRLADRELRDADAILNDVGRSRFRVRGISGVDDPTRFERFVRTDGWLPIDAVVHISKVASLVKQLGGEQLYGERSQHVALRELVQNSIDAVVARRDLEAREPSWGSVEVAIRDESGDEWLQVSDNGVGMSPRVLSETLLDFGTSLWRSEELGRELPGLVSRGGSQIGRFGIGFFSVFMLGEAVKVTSRRTDAGTADTFVLEFNNGLDSRPILRPADESERMVEPGTSVLVRLENGLRGEKSLIDDSNRTSRLGLAGLCESLFPASSVTIVTEELGARRTVVEANDWLSVDGAKLLQRLSAADFRSLSDYSAELYGANLREIVESDGTVVGRACIVDTTYSDGSDPTGKVVVGGIACQNIQHVAGILIGETDSSSRDWAVPIASRSALTHWASEQTLLVPHSISPFEKFGLAEVFHRLGVKDHRLPVAETAAGLLGYEDLVRWLEARDSFMCVSEFDVRIGMRTGSNVAIRDDVLVTKSGHTFFFSTQNVLWDEWPDKLFPSPVPYSRDVPISDALLREAICDAWCLSPSEFLTCGFELRTAVIADYGSEQVSSNRAEVVSRPASP